MIHTNKKHPFLTIERGFVVVASIILGMHLLEANGQVGVVTGWKVVPGSSVMYNLEVAQDHTFVVGDGQWVVHNCGTSGLPDPANKVDGQDNLYRGQQVDSDQLMSNAWTRIKDDVGSYVSDNFKKFLRSQGKNPSDFRYYMQTWKKGQAEVDNHYWYNMFDSSFGEFHHH